MKRILMSLATLGALALPAAPALAARPRVVEHVGRHERVVQRELYHHPVGRWEFEPHAWREPPRFSGVRAWWPAVPVPAVGAYCPPLVPRVGISYGY